MQADLKWLDDPQTFRVNQLPAHSDHQWYLDYAEADQQSSSFTQSLDGQWRFAFAKDPQNRIKEFYAPDYDVSKWDLIKVPSMIELNG